MFEISGFVIINKNNKIYIPCKDYNAICEVDCGKKTTRIVCSDKEEKLCQESVWYVSLHDDRRIVVAPFSGRKFIVMDFDDDGKYVIKTILDNDVYKYIEGFVYKDNYYFISQSKPIVKVINRNTLESYDIEIAYDVNTYSRAENYVGGIGKADMGNYIYFPIGINGCLLRFSSNKKLFDVIQIVEKTEQIESLARIDDDIWIETYHKEVEEYYVYVWNDNDGIKKKIKMGKSGTLHPAFKYNGVIYLIPYGGDGDVYGIDENTFEVSVFDPLNNMKMIDGKLCDGFGYSRLEGSKLFLLKQIRGSWISYDFETGEVIEEVYRIEDEKYKKQYYDDLVNREISEGRVLSEKIVPLDVFVSNI